MHMESNSCLAKIDVLKTNICPRREASRQRNDEKHQISRLIVPKHEHCWLYCLPLNFLPRLSSKIILNYFQLFLD